MMNINAVLVRLTIGKFSNQRQDVTITKEVMERHKLTGKAGRWTKFKLPDEALIPIREAESNARTTHYTFSLPWEDGMGMVKASARGRYEQEMAKCKQAFDQAVEAFVASYPDWIEQARVMHNGTFNPCDYPAPEKVREEFRFATVFYPVPSASHFSHELRESYGTLLEAENAKKIEQAVQETWNRLLQPIAHMADRLADPGAVFRDSLVDNVREIVLLIPALNLTDNRQLHQAAEQVKEKLAKLNPDTLRANAVLRREAAGQASAIVKTFGALGSRKFA